MTVSFWRQRASRQPTNWLRNAALALALIVAAPQTQASAQAPDPDTQSTQWYAQQLGELAIVLGGAHYLRTLCDGRGDQRWREFMQGVIQREPNYRAQLIEAFNEGYLREQTRFGACDANALSTEAELRARGSRIAGALRVSHAG